MGSECWQKQEACAQYKSLTFPSAPLSSLSQLQSSVLFAFTPQFSISLITMSLRSSSSYFTRTTPGSHHAASIYGGAGGYGTRISSSSAYGGLRSMPLGSSVSSSTAFKVSSGLSAGAGTGAGLSSGSSTILGDERGQMQNLNDRLASYLETVRRLEKENTALEQKIREAMEKAGPEARDYSKYNAILDDLRRKVRTSP